ncbi:hypothetical protein PENTCL1PPCAC_29803, partial [Pristionchus entomophagus]
IMSILQTNPSRESSHERDQDFELRCWAIRELRKASEKCASTGVQFSRVCSCCQQVSEYQHVASTACGHALCRGCADGEACPVCQTSTQFVPLFEDLDLHSRECGICLVAVPCQRSFFSACGHIICR